MNTIKAFIVTICVGLLMSSCLQEVDLSKISGEYVDDIGVALPVVRSNFTLKEVVVELKDSVIIDDESGRMKFIHEEDPLIDIDVIDLLDIGEGEFSGSVKISDIDIPDFLTLTDSITIRDVIKKVEDPILRLALEAALVSPLDIPARGNIELGEYEIWESEGVDQVSFEKGKLNVFLSNNMQLELGFVATIKDNSGEVLMVDTIKQLKHGETQIESIDVAGMDIKFPLTIDVSEANTPGGKVLFDENSSLIAEANFNGVIFDSAKLQIKEEIEGESVDAIEYIDKNKVLRTLKFTSGTLKYKITNMSRIDTIDLKLILPEFRVLENGVFSPISISETLVNNNSISGTIDLENASLDLENSDLKLGETLLKIETTVSVKPTNDVIEINYNDSIYGEFIISDVKLRNASGWFGQEKVDIPEEVTELWLGFFEEDMDNITMTNPQIKLNINNSFGISSRVDMKFKGVSEDRTKEAVAIIDSLQINMPDTEDKDAISTFYINRNNTEGLVDLINLPPAKVYHSGTILVNPDYDPENPETIKLNYFDESNHLTLGMRFEMPFEFIADSFTYEETLSFEWPDDTEDLYPRYLTISAVHNLPFYIMSEFVFLDKEGLPTDTVFGTLIKPAPYGEDGLSTDSIKSRQEIELNEEESNHLKETESVLMKTIIYTGVKDSVKEVILRATDYADIQIGVKGVLKVNESY